ncbi:MAG: molybdopterin converting factor subunit 1 [Pseudomonadales bacterium]|nr:molybdopterin converting factor subunit 1 [Pseudomonadales bacterium]
MKIKICYFAKIREQLGVSDELLVLPDGCDNLDGIFNHLRERGDPWQQVFSGDKKILRAVNHEVVSDNCTINDGDEVAFFPPVTGG